MGFYLVIFKKSLSTKNQDIKYNHLITNILYCNFRHNNKYFYLFFYFFLYFILIYINF